MGAPETPLDEVRGLLEKLDPTTRVLVAEVELGEAVKGFVESPVGSYLVGCAQQEIAEAQESLSNTAPWRRRRIQELQNRIWRAKALLSWLRDAVVAAQSAKSALTEAEYER